MGGDCESPKGWSLSVACLEDMHEEACRADRLQRSEFGCSDLRSFLHAGAFLQFSGLGPKQGGWDIQVTPGDCRAKSVLLHVLVSVCPHLGMRGKCLHSEGAKGT